MPFRRQYEKNLGMVYSHDQEAVKFDLRTLSADCLAVCLGRTYRSEENNDEVDDGGSDDAGEIDDSCHDVDESIRPGGRLPKVKSHHRGTFRSSMCYDRSELPKICVSEVDYRD